MKKKTTEDGGGRGKRKRTVNPLGIVDIDSADETTEDDEDFDPSEFDTSYSDELDSTKETTDDAIETPEIDPEEEKRRNDRLWSDFLSGVEKISNKKKSESEAPTGTTTIKKVYDFAGEKIEVEEKIPVAKTNGAASATTISNNIKSDSPESSCSSNSSTSNVSRVNNMPSGLAASSTITSSSSSSTVSSPCSSSSSTSTSSSSQLNKTTPTPPSGLRRGGISFLSGNPAQIGLATKPGTKRIGGLTAVLNALHSNKKSKIPSMNTMEKTKMDWQTFKNAEGIDEELKIHTKSKEGFIERQEFLQRADLRQFEIEKNLRARARRNP